MKATPIAYAPSSPVETLKYLDKTERKPFFQEHATQTILFQKYRLESRGPIVVAAPQIILDQSYLCSQTREYKFFTNDLKFQYIDGATKMIFKENTRPYDEYKNYCLTQDLLEKS